MNYECKKAENCFSDAENFEYRVELTGLEIVTLLRKLDGSVRINDKLRRPTFVAELASGIQVKGLLDKNVIKVGFVLDKAAEQKEFFESWLEEH